jgi:6-phosphogluconolactonase
VNDRLRVFSDADALAAAVADLVAEEIRAARRLRLALAGGTTPLRAYERLARMDLPWGRVSVFFGDERCVPPDHPDSNYKAAREALLARVTPLAVYRMPGELGPDVAAELYEPLVLAHPLDLVLLGIGPDGHTASLFPGHPALHAGGHVVGVRDAPKPPAERISLTLHALREARRVVIIVAGADKREAFTRAQRGEVPAGMIPDALWYVTRDVVE